MNPDIATLKQSLRAFTGAAHRLADDPQSPRDPNLKFDLQNLHKNELQDAVAAITRLQTVMNGGGR